MREAKNRWFQEKAKEAQHSKFRSKKVWQCIRDMQCGKRGMVSIRHTTIKDEERHLCTTVQEQQERWRRHFSNMLNMQSHHSETEIEKTRQRPMRHQMNHLRSREELIAELEARQPNHVVLSLAYLYVYMCICPLQVQVRSLH